MAVEENFLEHVPLSCLSPSTVRELGLFLDPGGAENDARRLAEILGCDYIFVRNLEERVDRTKYLFDSWWCLRPDYTVLKLKECLEKMEREDILTDVWPQIAKDAQAWERLPEPIPPVPVTPPEIDDSWMLTVHDMDPNNPARYHACLCYEEDDRDTADTFVNELTNIHPDIKFFVPHLHVIPGRYVYDCVAQVIDERCNKKVVIILPKKEFTDGTCDFALQYARALDPSAKHGNLIPVIRATETHTPRVLLGVSGIRMFMRNSPMLWQSVLLKLGVRISTRSSDSSFHSSDMESSQLRNSCSSHKKSPSSSDTQESDESVTEMNSKLCSCTLQNNVIPKTPSMQVEQASKHTCKVSKKPGQNIVGKKKAKHSAVVRLFSNFRRRLGRRKKKRACESTLDNVAQDATNTVSECSEDGTCAADSESNNGSDSVEIEDNNDCNTSDDKGCDENGTSL